MSKTMNTAELASELETNGRILRKFLRSITPKDEQPGKGARWSIPANARDLTKLRKQFQEWTAKQAEERAARAAEAAEKANADLEDAELDD